MSSGYGKRTLQFFHSSKYLIKNLKRFMTNNKESIKINKEIFINDRISINNVDMRQQQQYSIISVLNHLGDSMIHCHYACNGLIIDTWYEIHDNEYKVCLRPDESTTCYITLWKLNDNDLNTNDNNVSKKFGNIAKITMIITQ